MTDRIFPNAETAERITSVCTHLRAKPVAASSYAHPVWTSINLLEHWRDRGVSEKELHWHENWLAREETRRKQGTPEFEEAQCSGR